MRCIITAVPVKVNAMQDIFDQGVGDDDDQNRVFKSEHQLDRRSFAQGRLVRVKNEVDVNDCQKSG